MPRRRQQPAVSVGWEIPIDVVTTAVLTLIFHFVFDMPWALALLVAAPISIVGWWCLLHLERNDSSGSWSTGSTGGSGSSFWDDLF